MGGSRLFQFLNSKHSTYICTWHDKEISGYPYRTFVISWYSKRGTVFVMIGGLDDSWGGTVPCFVRQVWYVCTLGMYVGQVPDILHRKYILHGKVVRKRFPLDGRKIAGKGVLHKSHLVAKLLTSQYKLGTSTLSGGGEMNRYLSEFIHCSA